jgi:hypothetical protein
MIDAMRKDRDILVKHNHHHGALDFLASRLPGKKAAFMELIIMAVEFEEELVPLAEACAQVPKSQRSRISLDDLCKSAVPDIGISRLRGWPRRRPWSGD